MITHAQRYGLFCIAICSWICYPGAVLRTALNNKVSFDDLRIVINLCGCGSEIFAKQVPGRASRKVPGKEIAYIVEFRHPWDMKRIKTKAGYTREVPGPVLHDDMAREKIYSEMGFEQVKLNSELELPWIHNNNTQTR